MAVSTHHVSAQCHVSAITTTCTCETCARSLWYVFMTDRSAQNLPFLPTLASSWFQQRIQFLQVILPAAAKQQSFVLALSTVVNYD